MIRRMPSVRLAGGGHLLAGMVLLLAASLEGKTGVFLAVAAAGTLPAAVWGILAASRGSRAPARPVFPTLWAALTGTGWSAAAITASFANAESPSSWLPLLLGGVIVWSTVTLFRSLDLVLACTVPVAVTCGLLAAGGDRRADAAGLAVLLLACAAGAAVLRRRVPAAELRAVGGAGTPVPLVIEKERLRKGAPDPIRYADVSHEIRTPMNGIMGITNLLLDTRLSEDQRRYLTTLKDCGESLLRLVNDILDLSKLDAGKMRLETIEFELVDLLDSLVDQFAGIAARSGLDFTSGVDEGVPRRLRGDPGRLRQILGNLIDNALKFTREGRVSLRVSCRDAAAGLLCFEVTDTGTGIPERALEKIFEPFAQVEGSQGRKGGTGLGLSIVRRLARLMDGDIEVTSRPHGGSTFRLVAPFEAVAEVETGPAQPAVLAGVRALIVDDSETSRAVLRDMLAGWSCRVDTASSAEEALPALRAAAPEDGFRLVLMDMYLPGMDGLKATRAIRSDPLLAGTSVVMVTGFGVRGDATRAREAGCAGYLAKPVSAVRLRRVVSEALAGGGSERPGQIATRYSHGRSTARPSRILVVEDDPVGRKVVEVLLRHRGHEVLLAGDGLTALREIECGRCDLVLMDLEMPGMDGVETTRRIRARGGQAGCLPIIALTAHAGGTERDRALGAGMDDYLVKPLQAEDLDAALARHLGASDPPGAQTGAPVDATAGTVEVDPAVVDWERALERHLGDEPFLREAFAMFRTSARALIDGLGAAIEEGDLVTCRQAAHGLKGSASMLSVTGVSRLAREVEAAALDQDLRAARERFPGLRAEAERAFAFIDRLCREGGEGPADAAGREEVVGTDTGSR